MHVCQKFYRVYKCWLTLFFDQFHHRFGQTLAIWSVNVIEYLKIEPPTFFHSLFCHSVFSHSVFSHVVRVPYNILNLYCSAAVNVSADT